MFCYSPFHTSTVNSSHLFISTKIFCLNDLSLTNKWLNCTSLNVLQTHNLSFPKLLILNHVIFIWKFLTWYFLNLDETIYLFNHHYFRTVFHQRLTRWMYWLVGWSISNLALLQFILHHEATLIFLSCKVDYASLLNIMLQWLSLPLRIKS